MAAWGQTGSKFAGPLGGIINKWYFSFLVLVFVIYLSKTIIISSQEASMQPVFSFFEEKFLYTTLSMGEESKIIVYNGFFYI